MRFKKNNLSYLVALALSASGAVAHADSLNGSGGGWQTWNGNNLAADSSSSSVGTPYWNNASGDGPMENVGWCLSGGGNCSMPAGSPGALPYWGTASGAVGSMYFTSSGSPVNLTLQTVLTTQLSTAGGYDVFGYYLANHDSGNAPKGVTLNALFDTRTDAVGSSRSITSLSANQKYGFYIENVQGGGTGNESDYIYFMDSTGNIATGAMPADALQHFAVFNASYGSYFLGDVDDDACSGAFTTGSSPCVPSSQFDYNNMIVEVSSTPEPESLALMAAGLGLLAAVMLRRKSRGLQN